MFTTVHKSHVHNGPQVTCSQQSTGHMFTMVHKSHVHSSPQVTCSQQSTGHMFTTVHKSHVHNGPQVTCSQQSTGHMFTTVHMSQIHNSPHVTSQVRWIPSAPSHLITLTSIHYSNCEFYPHVPLRLAAICQLAAYSNNIDKWNLLPATKHHQLAVIQKRSTLILSSDVHLKSPVVSSIQISQTTSTCISPPY